MSDPLADAMHAVLVEARRAVQQNRWTYDDWVGWEARARQISDAYAAAFALPREDPAVARRITAAVLMPLPVAAAEFYATPMPPPAEWFNPSEETSE